MRDRLEDAEAVGYGTIEQKCGNGNNIREFFSGVFTLEPQLTTVQIALSEASSMLSCPNVNTLYTQGVHGSVCTDFASANASGFLLFLATAISSMILITLRAAWRSS